MLSKQVVWISAGMFLISLSLGCGGGSEEPSSEGEAASELKSDSASKEVEEESPIEESAIDIDTESIYPVVQINTNLGAMKLELYPDKAPATVDNFLTYVRNGFYDGTIFHRVVPDFVIQGGGFTKAMTKKETRAPIENEASNGLLNLRGTICMARTNDPHSATSQFFINTKDNPPLDFRDRSLSGWGYAVFGKITEGLELVDVIEGVQTTSVREYRDVPLEPVVIESMQILD